MKTSFLKRLSLLLLICILLPLFASCENGNNDTKIELLINDVALEKYALVYDADSLYAKFAAMNLRALLLERYNIELDLLADTLPEEEYEILFGDTNRITSDADTGKGLEAEQYSIETEGKKILLVANGYMIGGAAGGFADLCAPAAASKQPYHVTIDDKALVKDYQYKQAKSVLLYIGDGMGANHIEWAKKNGMPSFWAEDMPYQGMVTTHSADNAVTDSAASATALATGYKTNNSMLGMDPQNNILKNIRELAHEAGAKTAVVTTDKVTGATPSAFVAHTDDRDNSNVISDQLNTLMKDQKITVFSSLAGNRLLNESITAFQKISENDSPFFMMLEEAYIDKHSHSNKKDDMIDVLKRFNETIAYAIQFTLVRGDVLFVITSDHETGGVTAHEDDYQFTLEEHTAANVRLFAMGNGAEYFDGKTVDNTLIPHRLAMVFGNSSFGDPNLNK